MTKQTINPLRYPGAKRTLVPYVDSLLGANHLHGCVFVEPYAGSAAVGLELLQRGRISRLLLCEKDILLYAFWESVFRNTDRLIAKIQNTPVNIETWQRELVYRKLTSLEQADILELGFAGLFFNRTNFSGILNANPIGGMHQDSSYGIACRFNKSKIIDIIRQLSAYRDNVEVYCDDALHFMQSQKNHFLKEQCFVYFDPPYYGKGPKLYRHFYVTCEHIEFANYIKKNHHFNWLISYDDDPFICGLYSNSGVKYQPFFLDYTCSSGVRTQGKELLISNLHLPPFPMSNVSGL